MIPNANSPRALLCASRFCRKPPSTSEGAEAAFYETFFSAVTHWVTDLDAVVQLAMREASTNGIEAMDALHIAAAMSVGAVELITTEKSSRSIHRASGVKVVTIHPGV